MKKDMLCWVLLFVLGGLCSRAQTIPVGFPGWEDAVRRNQLNGVDSTTSSMLIRPLYNPVWDNREVHDCFSENKQVSFRLMPLVWKQQVNSDRPQGINDGALIPAKGYQTYLSAGFFAKYHFLSLQLNPELVFAANEHYDGFSVLLPDKYWYYWYGQVVSRIDNPEHFGSEPYKKFFWGQSSIRLNCGVLSLGLSTENLWWGPGYKNSLLMTNNAPGFAHFTLNTTKPLRTPIGSFEGQMVGGRLDASGFAAFDSARLATHGLTTLVHPKDWRYLNALVLVYQPKWLKGLHIGAARSFISYYQTMGSSAWNFIPVLTPLLKKDIGGSQEDSIKRDQLATVFFRWVMPEAGAEIYGEFGREDHSYDLTDLVLSPDHSRAYILGFRKMTPLNRLKGSYLDFQAEICDLTSSRASSYRANSSAIWYTHHLVLDGYTNQGQLLGSGIGYSSNMQWISLAWTKGLKRIGLEGTRLVHDDNFWAIVSQDYRTHWVDLSGAAFAQWDFKKFLFNAKLETTGSINYMWLYAPVPSDPPQWWDHGKIRWNVHAELGMAYVF